MVVVRAWLVTVLVVALLYLGGAILFNHATPEVLGMPMLYFWFVLTPLLTPLVIGALYLYDKEQQTSTREEYQKGE